MEMSERIDVFPATAEEAVGMAAAFCIADLPSLVSFSQWPDDLIIARQVTGDAACPCHTTNAPWSVAEMKRLSLVRFDDRTRCGPGSKVSLCAGSRTGSRWRQSCRASWPTPAW